MYTIFRRHRHYTTSNNPHTTNNESMPIFSGHNQTFEEDELSVSTIDGVRYYGSTLTV